MGDLKNIGFPPFEGILVQTTPNGQGMAADISKTSMPVSQPERF
jgi:hypothetical protein